MVYWMFEPSVPGPLLGVSPLPDRANEGMNMVLYAGTKQGLRLSAIGIVSAIVVVATAAHVFCGQEAPPTAKDSSAKTHSGETASRTSHVPMAEIQRAIAELGSAEFAVRERASRALWNAGAEAEAALEKAVRETDDFEVVYRAGQILGSFHAGIYPGTDPDIVVLIGRFRMGDSNLKQEIARRLKEKDKTDLLRRLIAKETDPILREQLNQILTGSVATSYPPTPVYGSVLPVPRVPDAAELARRARLRLAQGPGAAGGAALLLRRGASDESMRDYAALLLSWGKLDAAIKPLRDNLKAADAAGKRRLAWMLRAKGDLAGAVATARLVDDAGLVEDLLAEMADWKELAKIDGKADVEALAAGQDGAQRLARIMLFRHRAGEKQACDLAAAAAVKVLKQGKFLDGKLLAALILNDRVDQAIAVSQPQHLGVAFELMVAQNRMKEAFRLVKIDVPIPTTIDWTPWLKDEKGEVTQERFSLANQVVRALHVAGEDEQAHALITAMLAVVGKKLPEGGWDLESLWLVEAAVFVGRPESSDALAAKLMALNPKAWSLAGTTLPEMVISRLYRDQDVIAVLLWKALGKQFSGEDRPAALKHLRRLLTGKPAAAAVEELRSLAASIEGQLGDANANGSSDDVSSDPRARKLLALATLFHRYGQGKLTTKYLGLIGPVGVSARTLIDAGNLYAVEKQWSEAGKSYEAAWTKDRRSASALYLLGWAQTKRGEEAEGRKRMELALMIPLGDGAGRRDLARTLAGLHQDDEAARQRQRVLSLAAMHDWSIVQTLEEIGGAAAEKADAANLATVWQRFAVELLTNSGFIIETRYYLQWPVYAHCARARELLRAGKTAEAIEELHQAEAVQPANIQLALDCDAELRKHGAAGEADALYRRILEQHEAFCRDFPRSGLYHNNLAWLAANLDRDLDKALDHAQRAVELEPQAGNIDTLAEVYFRRGNRAEALRLARRCLEMEPDGEHYKKQLARFERP